MNKDVFQEKYRIDKLTIDKESPSKKYRLIVEFYDFLPDRCWPSNTKIIIKRIVDDFGIYDQKIFANYGKFSTVKHKFLTIRGEEWCWMSTGDKNILINLTRCAPCSITDCNPYMQNILPSPDEKTLAIYSHTFYDGIIVDFYDISTFPEPPPLPRVLQKLNCPTKLREYFDYELEWDSTLPAKCILKNSECFCKVSGKYEFEADDHDCPQEHWEFIPSHTITLQRVDNRMEIIDEWKSPRLIEQEEKDRQAEGGWQENVKQWRASSKLMSPLMQELEKRGYTCTNSHSWPACGGKIFFDLSIQGFKHGRIKWAVDEDPEESIYIEINNQAIEFPMSIDSIVKIAELL